MKKQIIDFVITWVDGSDPLWFRQKTERQKKSKEFLLISTTVLNAIATGKF